MVVFNNNLADFIEKYVKKGTKLFVEGSIKTRKYTGNDGIEKSITEIVISQFKGNITIISSVEDKEDNNNFQEKKQSNDLENQKIKELEKSLENLDLDDEIPF